MSTQHTGEPTAIGGGDRALETGDVVGEYGIQTLLGKGGFGTVYRAMHPVIGKQVAIKVLARRYSSDEAMVSRFVAEARAVNQIRHRNIIDIFSFGTLTDGRHYYVMEFLDGAPLDRPLHDHGALPLEKALPILRAIARALDAAHAKAHADKKLAAAYFRAGEKAYLAQNFEAAAKNLDEAFKELPAPEIAFSAAQAYRRAHRVKANAAYVARSVELYRFYLSKVTQGGRVGDAADNVGEMERELVALGGVKTAARVEQKTRLASRSRCRARHRGRDARESRIDAGFSARGDGGHQARWRGGQARSMIEVTPGRARGPRRGTRLRAGRAHEMPRWQVGSSVELRAPTAAGEGLDHDRERRAGQRRRPGSALDRRTGRAPGGTAHRSRSSAPVASRSLARSCSSADRR